jgi:dolichol kinase
MVVVTSLSMTWKLLPRWAPSFRFGADYDMGISIYLAIVASWFYLQQPSIALAPLFFADPAGAIVGKFFSKQGLNYAWWQNKTIAGTLAVGVVAYFSLDLPSTSLTGVALSSRFFVALACALGEAFGGQTYDNAVIALPALGSYIYYHV